mgnify:CR=1 FL=1
MEAADSGPGMLYILGGGAAPGIAEGGATWKKISNLKGQH